MNRSKVIATLISGYAVLSVVTLSWVARAWALSGPHTILSEVKGATTMRTSVAPLSLYPTITGTFPPIYSKEYILYNPESGKVISQSPELARVPVASITKIMTSYIVSKYVSETELVTISKEAVDQPIPSSLMGLTTGETISVHNLLLGALLVSGNDAAYAVAEYTGEVLLKNKQASSSQKIERFVSEMNNQAIKMGLENTHYEDPVGFNDKGFSTALDVAKLMHLVIKDQKLQTIMSIPQTTIYDESNANRFDLRNSNRLVAGYDYPGILGGKTGFTYEAGHCLVTAAKRNNITLISVILHTIDETKEASAIENKKLLDAGFSLVQWN